MGATKTVTALASGGAQFVPDSGVQIGADQATSTISNGYFVAQYTSSDGGPVVAFVRRIAGTAQPVYSEDKYHKMLVPGVPHRFVLQPDDFLFTTLQFWIQDGGNLVNLQVSLVTIP